MYLFYIDETGSRDPETQSIKADGTIREKDPLYALTAVGIYEYKWRRFEALITRLKIELADNLKRAGKGDFRLDQIEVKSSWLRQPRLREKESPFLAALDEEGLARISGAYYAALEELKMTVISVVVDKRHLQPHMDHVKLHLKTYELLLERIDSFLAEYHPKHQAVIIADDTDKSINRPLVLKHAYFQREGNQFSRFRHILEYPFFTDSNISNGVQLADLVGYNVYRVFKFRDFDYPWFQRILPRFHCSALTSEMRLDGLYVWPGDSSLLPFLQENIREAKQKQPSLWDWAASKRK